MRTTADLILTFRGIHLDRVPTVGLCSAHTLAIAPYSFDLYLVESDAGE